MANGDGRITTVDALNLTAILLLAVLVAFFRRQLGADALWLLGVLASLSLFVLLSVFLSGHRPLWRVVHDFSPVLIIPVLFNTLGPIINCASPLLTNRALMALGVCKLTGAPRFTISCKNGARRDSG